MSECWIWPFAKQSAGYGVLRIKGRSILAHRWTYELIRGTIPDGLQIDHLCRVRACVNPSHMEPVTHKVNSLRGVGSPAQNARKQSCKWGHEFTEENTYIKRDGSRNCRACHRTQVLAAYYRSQAVA